MKLKTLLATLLGTFMLHHPAFCQTNVVTPDQPPAVVTPSEVAADAVATAPDARAAITNQAEAVVANTASVAVVAAEVSATTNAAAPEAATIPLIQLQEVPITTAIENLARQAGMNYLLDPKIAYGQPDANGQVKPEPTLSIRWENITPGHALLALLDNYGLQMVNDPKTKISRVTTKDPTAPPPLVTRVVQLKYMSTSNMMEAATSALTDKRSKVVPDTRTSQLIIVATEPEQASIDTLVAQLDKPTRQVLIETRLVEIKDTPASRKGINWAGTLSSQNVTFGNNLSSDQTTIAPGLDGSRNNLGGLGAGVPGVVASTLGGFGAVGFLNADGLSAVLSFINASADAQIVSTPRLVTLDNEAANIAVTRSVPIFQVTAGSANTTGGSSVTYSNVGTTLTVTPRISADDKICLKVTPEVSNQGADQSQSVASGSGDRVAVLTAPTFENRAITTQVIIPNANTLVMGGLVFDNPKSTATKVPILGDIPYLGHAFRSETKLNEKTDLVIFITPTIVKDEDFQLHPNNFLATQPDFKRPGGLNEDSMWDSTKPFDWSNPTKKPAAPASTP